MKHIFLQRNWKPRRKTCTYTSTHISWLHCAGRECYWRCSRLLWSGSVYSAPCWGWASAVILFLLEIQLEEKREKISEQGLSRRYLYKCKCSPSQRRKPESTLTCGTVFTVIACPGAVALVPVKSYTQTFPSVLTRVGTARIGYNKSTAHKSLFSVWNLA